MHAKASDILRQLSKLHFDHPILDQKVYIEMKKISII